ncbi:MAG: hypothetical protein OXI15_13700 [Chromatiales bacterium]|nr:hypothetical protein [Chromatiales bacterium]
MVTMPSSAEAVEWHAMVAARDARRKAAAVRGRETPLHRVPA